MDVVPVKSLVLIATTLVLVSGSAAASQIETATGGLVAYQEDAHKAGDAPDACELLDTDRVVSVDNVAQHALLVHEDDVVDYFVLGIGADNVGDRIQVLAQASDATLPSTQIIDIDVLLPDCGDSVFAELEAAPAAPAAAAAIPEGSKEASNQTATYTCNPAEWKLIINQLHVDAAAVPSIHIQWSDGSELDLAASKYTPAAVAMYETNLNLGTPLWKATAVVPAEWAGEFKISHGPCVGTATPPPPPVEPPIKENAFGEFTVTIGEPHVVVVIYEGMADLLATETEGATAGGLLVQKEASCHDFCLGLINYDVLGKER